MTQLRASKQVQEKNNAKKQLLRQNIQAAKRMLGQTPPRRMTEHLKSLSRDFGFSIQSAELPHPAHDLRKVI